MDIKTLLEEDGFTCKYIARTYGGTYSSPCPWCGGIDRFRCFPNNENWVKYLCQKCCKKGSVLTYLTEFRGMDYSSAVALSGVSLRFKNTNLRSRLLKKDNKFKEPSDFPCKIWQQKASEFIQSTAETIWHKDNAEHLDWLMKRGLNASTIRKYNIGYNSADTYHYRKTWGLPDVNGLSDKMAIPAGIVIPYAVNDKIQKIKIRRSDPQAQNKYHVLAGSDSSVMVLGSGSYHIVVESELDGILIAQEVGDLVTVIVLGSANNRPDAEVMKQLVNSELVLLSLDNDTAGVESSYKWWMKTVPNAKRWAPLNGKDPGESYQNGVNIRQWVKAGILKYKPSGIVNLKQNQTLSSQSNQTSNSDIKKGLSVLAELKNEKAVFVNILTTGNDFLTDSIKEIHLSDAGNTILKIKGEDSLKKAKDELKALFLNKNYKIFYGAKSQLKTLRKHGFKVIGPIFDQKIGKKLIYTGTKDIVDHIEIDQMKIGHKAVVEELQKNNMGEVFQLEMDCIPVITQMEMNGMLIEKKAVKVLLSKLKKQLPPLKDQLYSYFGKLNLDSYKELKAALTANNILVPDTKKKTLIPLIPDYPILQELILYKQVKGNIEKCNEILRNINPANGRVHPVYNQVVDTGRMSCSKPNIHSIPKKKEFRRLFIAPEGSSIIRADFSQIELRVAAEISGDTMMINAFNEGRDLHRLTASLIMEKSIEDVTGVERQRAKPVNFGLLFDMSAKGLQEHAMTSYQVFLPIEEAEMFRNRFFSAYQGFAQWQHEQRFRVETRTLSGRRRIWGDQEIRPAQLLNSRIQGTAADILKKSLVILSDALIGTSSKIIGAIHDEILVEVLNKNTDNVKNIVEKSMIEAGNYYLKTVQVEVEVSDSVCWK